MPSLSAAYRPKTFAEITGQDSLKETLRLEVETGKLGHAYLFSGPRGVGKTTMARVFAKALNCLHPDHGEPCNACESCNATNAGNSLDVIEMDAASNTGVDNVREAIIEHVRYAPQRTWKIYLLDEAHMLSASAWNALLKTIEEPPAYAVFLFLTTELHKVPTTIASRCQRFDFRRITDEAMVARIEKLAEREGVAISPEVIRQIISHADGCVRDAESLLSQLLVLGEKNITAEIARAVIPSSQLPIAAELLGSWSRRALGPAFAHIEEIEARGIPLLPLFDDLLHAVRQLLLASDSVEWRQKLVRGDEGERNVAALVTAFEPAELSDMALMLMERRRDAKQGVDDRFCLELAASAVCLYLLPHAQPISPRASSPARAPLVTPVTPAVSGTTDVVRDQTTNAQASIPLSSVLSAWPTFLRLVDAQSTSLTFILKITQPASVVGDLVTLRFMYPFHREKILNDLNAKRMVESVLAEALKVSKIHIDGIVHKEHETSQEANAQDTISNILKLFGGTLENP